MQTIDITNRTMVLKHEDGLMVVSLEQLVMGGSNTVIGYFFSNEEPLTPLAILRKSHYGELILAQCLKELSKSCNYQPKFPKGYYYWAVAADGYAKFCKTLPEPGSTVWHSTGDAMRDENFNPLQFKHMWENGRWKNSLIENSNF